MKMSLAAVLLSALAPASMRAAAAPASSAGPIDPQRLSTTVRALSDVSVSGDSKGELQDELASDAVAEGRRFIPDAEPAAEHFYRSDHFSFSKRGTPALSIKSGTLQ